MKAKIKKTHSAEKTPRDHMGLKIFEKPKRGHFGEIENISKKVLQSRKNNGGTFGLGRTFSYLEMIGKPKRAL